MLDDGDVKMQSRQWETNVESYSAHNGIIEWKWEQKNHTGAHKDKDKRPATSTSTSTDLEMVDLQGQWVPRPKPSGPPAGKYLQYT